MNFKSAILPLLIGVALYVLVNLTPERQYALVIAVAGFLMYSILPLYQAYLAYEQLQVAKRQEQREIVKEQERRKRAVLALTLWNGNTIEFYPVGGHRNPKAIMAFTVYVENSGDAKAEDTVVKILFPRNGHPTTRPPVNTLRTDEGGHNVMVPLDQDPSEELRFKYDTWTDGQAGEIATLEIHRPIYPSPHEPRRLGLVVGNMPEGKHRFDWIVESNCGRTESSEETAIYAIIYDTARGHDPTTTGSDDGDEREGCRLCVAFREGFGGALHQWAENVDRALGEYRITTPETNPDAAPKMTSSPAGVQWYEQWTGPHRWVTCEPAFDERPQPLVRAYFWTEGQWSNRQMRIVTMDEPGRFADDILAFFRSDEPQPLDQTQG